MRHQGVNELWQQYPGTYISGAVALCHGHNKDVFRLVRALQGTPALPQQMLRDVTRRLQDLWNLLRLACKYSGKDSAAIDSGITTAICLERLQEIGAIQCKQQ